MAPITTNEFGVLKEGLLSQRQGVQPLSRFGIDFTLTPQSALFGTLPFVGQFGQIADIINQQQVNQIARKALGKEPRSTFDAFTTGDFSATRQLQQQLIDQYGPNFTRRDVQEFGRKNFPELDLAPLNLEKYSKEDFEEFKDLEQEYKTQPFAKGSAFETFSIIDPETKQQTLPSYDTYFMTEDEKGNQIKSTQTFGEAIRSGAFDDQLKSTDQFAGDSITQSNIGQRDAQGNFIPSSTYDPAFARAVTLEQQSDTADAESTFICTALYKKGLLPRKIYLCDVIYGRKINFYTYKGYEIWGKWFAKKIETNKTIYNAFYPIFVKWSNQMAYEISGGKYGKNNIFIKLCKTIGEKISYSIGWISERRTKWQNT